jgi:hypothetical protein
MKNYYSLRINSNNKEEIFMILGISSNFVNSDIWIYEVIEGEQDPYFDFINEFLNILDGKYESLSQIGISREDITIWLIYEYDNQCNLEFDPNLLYRLGKENIRLCISCYQF